MSKTNPRCAVIGNPIAHSKSPYLHRQFAEQLELPLDYQKFALEESELNGWVHRFFAEGGTGLNVTLPFKNAALTLAHFVYPRAERAGAANTLGVNESGAIWAENTDGIGLVRDLHRLGHPVRDQHILIIGAGGAARGVIPALLDEGVACLSIVNRTEATARSLIEFIDDPRVKPHHVNDRAPDILISTISEGIEAQLTLAQIKSPLSAYDLNYGERSGPFKEQMRRLKVSAIMTGEGMLIEQAAESFRLWHGHMPNTAPFHSQGLPR